MWLIAQLVEHRTGIAEVTGSNPVEALIFFGLLLSNCLNWKIYCDDHISLSFFSFWSIQEVSVRISDFIFETTFFNLPFRRSYALDNAMIFDEKFK